MTRQETEKEIDQEVKAAMESDSVRKVASLKERNADIPTDEKSYRQRLEKNGPGLIDQMIKNLED